MEDSATAIRLPPRRAGLRLWLQLALVATDLVALVSAVVLVSYVWLGRLAVNSDVVLATFAFFYLLIGVNGGAFAADVLARRRNSFVRATRSVALACAAVILVAFFLKAGDQVSRVTLVIGGFMGIGLVGLARLIFHGWSVRKFGIELHTEVLLLDDYAIPVPPGVFVFDMERLQIRTDLKDPDMLNRLGQLLATADRVVVACSAARRRDWAMMLKGSNVRVEIVSPELTNLGPLGVAHFEQHATVVVATGLLMLRQRAAKRALDILLAGGALVLLAPALLLVAALVRLDSPGPALFVQMRVGRGNRMFGIYKFRSMRAEMSDRNGTLSASRDDKRITRIGRVIRATSIDELPQLLNVLKGDMSIVGPRPHALGSLAGDLPFWEVDERYWHRHTCKPGLTGLAQVRGFRGATHRESDLTNRLQADLEYTVGWTIWRDLAIMLATLRVLVHRNAY